MTSDNVQALPIGTQLGDFRLDAVIGHGSFGITYRAFDAQLAKVVAIKEYLPIEFAVRQGNGAVGARGARFADDFAWGRERFLDEARALARFRHPHIVPVLRYFEANGTAYTVMEFEDGRSLGEILNAGDRIAEEDVRRLTDGLLSGLAAVHAQGFLHRDIKPSNIIIRRDGVPILIDFGAARQAMGGRTQTLTSVLTPQYAPIEQYALDGRQGPWSDIYSAAAVLHHAIVGRAPPQAASRVGSDPYRALAVSEQGRFDPVFLAAVDRGLAFAADERPQSVAAWRALFATSLPSARDAATQRMVPAVLVTPPRLGGVNRDLSDHAPPSIVAVPRRSRAGIWLVVLLIVIAAGAAAWWRLGPQVQDRVAAVTAPAPAPSTPQASAPTPPPSAPVATPSPAATPSPTPAPTPTPLKPPSSAPQTANVSQPPSADLVAQKALISQAELAAGAARTTADKAKEASDAARTMAGEARIAAARASRSGLENTERLSYPNGASYVGQTASGQRVGLGVADLAGGERQAGEWKDDRMSGLGTVRLADGARYEGQWRDGQSTGLGVREKPGSERAEGNFVDGRLEGFAVRRQTGETSLTQAGEFHADQLEGPGIETMPNGERYEGELRAGKRHGYGQIVIPDAQPRPGRWEAGQQVESLP